MISYLNNIIKIPIISIMMALTPTKTPIKYIRLLHYSVDVNT